VRERLTCLVRGQAVNAALIDLSWEVVRPSAARLRLPSGAKVLWIDLPSSSPERNLAFVASVALIYFRRRQFYEAYREEPIVSPVVRQLPWSHHLIILGRSKRTEEREFYVWLRVCCAPWSHAGDKLVLDFKRRLKWQGLLDAE
jgi:hypothetical protein